MGRLGRARIVVLAAGLLGAPFAAVGAEGAQEGTVALEYVAHASFLIRSPGGIEILIDPFASRVWIGYEFPAEITPDLILITHPHYDHDAGRYQGAPFPWPASIPVHDAPGEHRVADVRLLGVAGRHADPYGQEFGQINTLWVIETGGLRIAHLGDNGPLTRDDVDALGAIDILMLPVDGDYHILSAQSVAAAITVVGPRVVVPMHYRHPELEEGDGPEGLGPIEPWIAERGGVVRLGSHRWEARRDSLLPHGSILVFDPSPLIPRRSQTTPAAGFTPVR